MVVTLRSGRITLSLNSEQSASVSTMALTSWPSRRNWRLFIGRSALLFCQRQSAACEQEFVIIAVDRVFLKFERSAASPSEAASFSFPATGKA